MDHTVKAYSTKEISLTLGIGDSTLRKWCLALEKNGYKFLRNEREQRLFVEKDIVVLKHFQQLVQEHNMQLDNAGMIVADRFKETAFEVGTDIVLQEDNAKVRYPERSNEVLNKLLEHIERQEQFNQELISKLDQQQKYIEDRLNERDKTLLESLREVQETKRLIAASQEEVKKKGFFDRLFGK